MDYIIESIDDRPQYHKKRVIKNILNLETTPRHYIFITDRNKVIKLRTDTWRPPKLSNNPKGQGWHEKPDLSGKAPLHVKAATQTKNQDVLRQPIQVVDEKRDAFEHHLTAMIQKAVAQDPNRLAHGATRYNAFWIDGNKIIPYNEHDKVINSRGVISVHSHSGSNWRDYDEKTDELQPINGGDLAGLSHMVKYGYGDTIALISAYGEMEYIRFNANSNKQFLSLTSKQLIRKTEVPRDAEEEFVRKGMGTTYDLWRKLIVSFCDYYELEYRTGLRWK